MDKTLFLNCRIVRDPVTLKQQLGCKSASSFGIGVHCAKRLSTRDAIADFAMENDSNRRINRIFLLLAPAPENYAGGADRFAVHGGDIAILRAAYIVPVFRARKSVRFIQRANVSTL